MRNHKPAFVQHQVAWQRMQKIQHGVAKALRLRGQLVQGPRHAARHLYLAATQHPHQLAVAIAGHAKRRARARHAHRQPQHRRRVWTAVHHIAHKSQRASLRRGHRKFLARPLHAVAHRVHQSQQLVQATVHIAYNVERSARLAQSQWISRFHEPVPQSGLPIHCWP